MKSMEEAPEEVLEALPLYFALKYPKMKPEQVFKEITKIMNKMGYYYDR